MARLVRRLCALLALATTAIAADWLSERGDAQRSGWQQHGKQLTVENVKDIKLLWTLRFDRPLSTPVIIGPTITHRGVRELIFASNWANLYAIDADLGSIFWKRGFQGAVNPGAVPLCTGPMAPPVIEPDPKADDREDDEPGPMRPIYVAAGDGQLHRIRPSDGEDMSPPVSFVTGPSGLNLWSKVVYAGVRCSRPAGVWSLDTKPPGGSAACFTEGTPIAVSIGFNGGIYAAFSERIVALSADMKPKSSLAGRATDLLVFQWNGRQFVAASSEERLLLLDSESLSVAAEARTPDTLSGAGGMATWQDARGSRWIFAATQRRVVAFRLKGGAKNARVDPLWTSSHVTAPAAPVVVNGVVFVVAGSTLHALEATTGRELFRSDPIASKASTDLAVANGHLCFGAADNTLYCFGIPIER